MNETLRDIQDQLRRGAYKNEEHVRLCLVTGILAELDWNIWDPAEVNAEWAVARNEDGTKVDLALFANSSDPSVYIEIKAVGRLVANLQATEQQVRDYNRNNTATFAVITDGQIWRLYLSQVGGEFSQKVFKVVDLLRDDLVAVEETFKSFLSKAAIDIGSAKAEAERLLRLGQKQRAMEASLPDAHRAVVAPPYPTLPEVLVRLVRAKGHMISIEEATEFISSTHKPHTIVQDLPSLAAPVDIRRATLPTGVLRTLPPDNPGDLRWAKIEQGEIAGAQATRWNELVGVGIREALRRGKTFREVSAELPANLREGNHGDKGFVLIPQTNVSMQNMDSGHAAMCLTAIARMLNCRLRVEVRWGGDSPFAGQTGVIELNP